MTSLLPSIPVSAMRLLLGINGYPQATAVQRPKTAMTRANNIPELLAGPSSEARHDALCDTGARWQRIVASTSHRSYMQMHRPMHERCPYHTGGQACLVLCPREALPSLCFRARCVASVMASGDLPVSKNEKKGEPRVPQYVGRTRSSYSFPFWFARFCALGLGSKMRIESYE